MQTQPSPLQSRRQLLLLLQTCSHLFNETQLYFQAEVTYSGGGGGIGGGGFAGGSAIGGKGGAQASYGGPGK